jgi:hypothetical protein
VKPFSKNISGISHSLFFLLLGGFIFFALEKGLIGGLLELALRTLLAAPVLWYLWKFVLIPFREGLSGSEPNKGGSQHRA